MKTVTIQIEVEVPDGTTHVAVDKKGTVVAFNGPATNKPVMGGIWKPMDNNDTYFTVVSNWRETLTEVEDEDDNPIR